MDKQVVLVDSFEDIIGSLQSVDSSRVVILSDALHAAADRFIAGFPGDTMYAVKCNNHPNVIKELSNAGIKHLDVASIAEVRLAHSLAPQASLHFMNPVKSREAIYSAFFHHNVTTFVIDSLEELEKIHATIGTQPEVTVPVRFATQAKRAVMCLGGKFGAEHAAAGQLMREVVARGYRTGLAFHVGSQCEDPSAFSDSIHEAVEIARLAEQPLDFLDVGGGFPGGYTKDESDLSHYFQLIEATLRGYGEARPKQLFCEPGRALVSHGQSTLVRIELRRGNDIFLTDGVFGTLSELRYLGTRIPLRAHRDGRLLEGPNDAFRLFGPTCDNIDMMPGPFLLPQDLRENDWIEVQRNGAYSGVYRTKFNGFYCDDFVQVRSSRERNTATLSPTITLATGR